MTACLAGILMTSGVTFFPGSDIHSVVTCFLFSCGLLMMNPCSYEKPGPSLVVSILTGTAGCLFLLGCTLQPPEVFLTFILLTGFLFNSAMSSWRRFHEIKTFFRNSAAWHSIEDYSRSMYAMAFLCLCVTNLCAMLLPGDSGTWLAVLVSFLGIVLFALLYLRSASGRTCFIGRELEDRVKDMSRNNLRAPCIDKSGEDRRMNNLYKKIMAFMNDEKPYLDSSFCMNDLAERVYSNKLYLSRTINLLSGRNFRQFLNYHRVQYAMDIFKKDPKLKVSEAAVMSGFNSTVSFNMAFKVNTGMTPSEWLQEHAFGSGEGF